jgi:hypothetical protein
MRLSHTLARTSTVFDEPKSRMDAVASRFLLALAGLTRLLGVGGEAGPGLGSMRCSTSTTPSSRSMATASRAPRISPAIAALSPASPLRLILRSCCVPRDQCDKRPEPPVLTRGIARRRRVSLAIVTGPRDCHELGPSDEQDDGHLLLLVSHATRSWCWSVGVVGGGGTLACLGGQRHVVVPHEGPWRRVVM